MREYALEMTTTEVKPITVPVLDLQQSETVESTATITHIPPSGSPLTINYTVVAPNINFLLGPLGVIGQHYVKVQARGNAGSKPEVLFSILVKI
jgi:hypothetical protein